ncbi:MAG: dockerin type I repeat-containing protein [Muribaculaceae bacterium]|nr:dockerin type I repeat-containing protein [Muribaculaceae bacterium]
MRIVQLLLLSLLMALPFNAFAQQTLYGDVNGDFEVNIADINSVINIIFNGTGYTPTADVNSDNKINIADINALVDHILNPSSEEPNCEYIDLGLPSGTLWATRNVGASTPEDYGDYFAWGETSPKELYNWETYKWCNGSYCTMTKYCTYSSYGDNGFVDNKTELDPADDAACAHYPGGRMPSYNQILELCNSCSWQWTQLNGVNGQLVTGPNGNTMFLPAAGGRWGDSLGDAGLGGYFWSRTLDPNCPSNAYSLCFDSGAWIYSNWSYYTRFIGFTIRAVRVY